MPPWSVGIAYRHRYRKPLAFFMLSNLLENHSKIPRNQFIEPTLRKYFADTFTSLRIIL